MKFLAIILLALSVSCAYGFPKKYFNYHNSHADFRPCSTVASLQTLWPDFNNNHVFLQCRALNLWGVHQCPANLWFSFHLQVCVWESQWVSPPPPDQITPFPTTQWPPPDSTTQQEITSTVSISPPTLPPVTTDDSETTQEASTPPISIPTVGRNIIFFIFAKSLNMFVCSCNYNRSYFYSDSATTTRYNDRA